MEELLKTDVDRIKAELKKAVDTKLDVDDRLASLDELEMLVEQIDNANALAAVNGIVPLVHLFDDPDESIQMQAVWVIGTSSHNNKKFSDIFAAQGGFDALISLLEKSKSLTVLSRIIYALSGLIMASPTALQKALEKNVFQLILSLYSSDTADLNLKRKIAFFLGGLIFEHSKSETLMSALLQMNLIETIVAPVVSNANVEVATDSDLIEKVFEVLENCFNASPEAVERAKGNEAFSSSLKSWAQKADVPAENKTSISKTLQRIGIAMN